MFSPPKPANDPSDLAYQVAASPIKGFPARAFKSLTLGHGHEQFAGIKPAMGQVHPEIVTEHAEIFRIVGDETAANIRRTVFFYAPEEFEQLRGFEVLEQMAAINAVAVSRDFAHFFAPEKLEDVDLEIFDAEPLTGRDRFGVAFNPESGDPVFFQRAQKESAPGAEIENFRTTGEVGNMAAMKFQHFVIRKTELVRIETVSLEQIRFGRVQHLD